MLCIKVGLVLVEDTEDCPYCLNLLFCWQCSKQTYSRGTSYHARESLCFFANPCLDCGWVLRPHSFHRPSMLSAHDHRFPFRGITVALNIDDSYPQQVPNIAHVFSKSII